MRKNQNPLHSDSFDKSEREISIRLDDNRTFDGSIEKADDNLLTISGSDQSFEFSEIKHLWDADSTDPLILEAQKIHWQCL